MKKILTFVTIMLLGTLTNVSYANDGDSKIKIVKVKHEKYVNVVEINITSAEPILYASFINPEGEVLHFEKVHKTTFTKLFSLNMTPEELNGKFTMQIVLEDKTIEYTFIPCKILKK